MIVLVYTALQATVASAGGPIADISGECSTEITSPAALLPSISLRGADFGYKLVGRQPVVDEGFCNWNFILMVQNVVSGAGVPTVRVNRAMLSRP